MNLANRITIARMLLIPLFILFFAEYPLWLTEKSGFFGFIHVYGTNIALGIFLLASATDKLDGYIARKYNQITNLGKLLDPLADKLLISVALIMMVQSGMVATWIAVVIIAREFVITGLRMVASEQGIALSADSLGKLKMVLQVIAIAAVLLDNYPFQLITMIQVDEFLMLAAVALTIYSGIHYLLNNYKLIKLN
ncbi:CDP-diacylglycerol--glycerol-3-phosphate 3-phosphatidyltransferase [Paenibacillus sp. FSL W8-0187]|jgi:CDP-diacylglycerol---glycerol-3-phosphate 3-phosphatidyltransferase|uniref:CDP-diacylglycerol--glycerol-3-phosphate 3-phosphatidyltransferase n=1 Tax=Paenibacillus lautus TaxID=1401 RepID=A0A1R1AW10_PAELA|nr:MULTISPECIES: CDP-diacylglycerol--glycerol-3-phosphate 3-phosphatidyltransferase [Paenibacillus]MBT2764860.1 CDP-diacylglycerol--glycerol-3-phosphate 3-phosphatidyltransferase [Paenibacillus sp. ISL-20]OME89692.1 CDP-diacylglycerol--glycerol-3-phosphate 3-phosphatidyltransferase [Paenibacillus lautus]